MSLLFRGLALICLLLGSWAAAAPRVAVFPFNSRDPNLGLAVADRLTHALAVPSLPPELTLGLVPPYVLQDGRFISPLSLLGQDQTGSESAAALLREHLNVEVAVTGRVRLGDEGLELSLFVAQADSTRRFLFRAPETAPAQLVSQARAALTIYAGLPVDPDAPLSLDLSSPYGTFIGGLASLASGAAATALPRLEEAARVPGAEPRWERRAAALRAVLAGEPTPQTPLLAGVVGLNAETFDARAIRRAFAPSPLPLARLWDALLAVQAGDTSEARQSLIALQALNYPYADIERVLFDLRDENAVQNAEASLRGLLRTQPDALAVMVGGLFVAQTLGNGALETDIATRLTRRLPEFAYAYERLSQTAFDRNDPLAAAIALKTATRLEPGSSLYWTNLGWAYYLLGALDESEAASQRATELDDNDFIARYNLGLVQVVTGRLEVAVLTYEAATSRDLLGDNTLDPAATDDLRQALTRYPDEPGIRYVLALLYEMSGRLDAAATEYARYAATAQDDFAALAERQAEVLRAPPPPIEISRGARLGVGPEVLSLPNYVSGDLLYPQFEISTPGDEVSTPFEVHLRLRDAAGKILTEGVSTERTPLPPETVAIEITNTSLELPEALQSGRYGLEITVRSRGREARVTLPLRVAAGRVPLARRLLGRSITLRDAVSGQPLYSDQDAAASWTSDRALIGTLLGELERSASAAAETLPEVGVGRFAGQTGDVLFDSSRPQDVRDFLGYLLAAAPGTDASFADLYANWALEGAPTP